MDSLEFRSIVGCYANGRSCRSSDRFPGLARAVDMPAHAVIRSLWSAVKTRTLTEWCGVVAILAVLVALLLPALQQVGDGDVHVDVSFDAPVREGVTIDLLYYRAATSPDDEGATEPRLRHQHWEDATERMAVSLPYSVGRRLGWLGPYSVSHRPNRMVGVFRDRTGEEVARVEEPISLSGGPHRIMFATPVSVQRQ
jgi:hypothetical protein